MRLSKILRILSLALILSLLVVAIPATPALAAPAITLSPNSGAIGTRVTVTGANFESYRGDNVSIFFNNVEIANSPQTIPDTGSFSVYFDIPDNATPGRAWIIIRSQLGSELAKSLFIIPETEIKLDTEEGAAGTIVTVSGEGFYAGKIVTFYYFNRDSEKMGTKVATLTGEYSFSFTIPDSIAGKHKITAENAQGNSAEAEFEVTPSISLNPTSGTVGDMLTVSGTGFDYRSDVTIYLKNTEVAYAKTDKYGSFESTFDVPIMKSDTYDIKVEDEDDNTDRVEFTIIAKASLNKTTGNVGTELLVTGTGYTAGGTVTIKYDATSVATAIANNNGAFSIAFTVPTSIGGKHLVTVSDGINTKQVTFTMEAEAPPAPQPLLPQTGDKAKSPIKFEWEEVNDPSLPITYRLQVAFDEHFIAIVLEKEGLTESGYTLTKAEELEPIGEKEPYYWRVKAIDDASNESQWSTPGAFYIGSAFTMPGWVIYLLIALGALIAGFFIFWLGRRTAYYTP